MQKKNIIIGSVIIILIAAGSFYGGMAYEKKQVASSSNTRNLSSGQQRQFAGNGAMMFRSGNGQNAGFANGEVISKDDKGLTIKMRDGSTKLVFFSSSTKFQKSSDGSVSDVETGKTVLVTGQAGSDGSITAQTVQIGDVLRPTPPSGQPQQ